MDLDARIERRRRRTDSRRLIQNYEALSPIAHIDDPSNRGPIFERVLDHLDAVFDERLPPNGYVYGPAGAGKSAVITALFTRLEELSTDAQSIIHTSTRVHSPSTPRFVYVDLRETKSPFAFYHSVLDGLVEEPVPNHGVSTERLRTRLGSLPDAAENGVVIAVDHVDDPDTIDTETLTELFGGLPSTVSWLAIGRSEPEQMELTGYTAASIEINRYQRQPLTDILMTRASKGLTQGAFDHGQAREVAEWADGNAHDALAALFISADRADRVERTRITDADIEAATGSIPQPSVSLGRVLALPANRQLVLRKLVDLDTDQRASVTATTEAISSAPGVDLSPGTVKRFLYEMAESGIVERVRTDSHNGTGRPPSRIELRFSPTAFCQLYAHETDG